MSSIIDKANIKNLYRLSPLQGGMLFHALYDEGERSYFEQGVYRVDGAIDLPAFEGAWNAIVERHDALRTAFVVKGVPEPLQVVLKKRPLRFHVEDLAGVPADSREQRIAEYCARDKERGFDLTRDPLLRIALFRRAEDDHAMVLSFHHIIMDGWCQGILADEFLTIYNALRNGRPVPLPPAPQYREYIRWLERQDKAEALAYWKGYLKSFDHPTNFPRRAEEQRNEGPGDQRKVSFRLTEDATTTLKEFALRNGVTLSTVVQGLWGILLGRVNGTNDALFLSTVSGRPDDLANAGRIVGLFINALPTRVRFREEERFAELVATMQRDAGESQFRQFAPLAEIQGNTALRRDISNTLLVFENYPFAASGSDAPFTITQQSIDERTNYDVTVQIHPDNELGFGIAFDPHTIDPALIAGAEEWIAGAARRLADNPDATVAEFNLQSSAFESEIRKSKSEERKPVRVAVAGTFTIDPALPYLEWWLRERGYAPTVEVAPYNQIFQELLDPSSLLSRTDGFAFLAVRFEDWIRDPANEGDEEVVLHLERSYAGYLRALDGFSGKGTPIHLLLPTDFSSFSPPVAEKLRELGERIIQAVAERGNLFLLDARDLHRTYAVSDPFDRVADRAGHVPYTPEMNAAIGTGMARKVLARDQHPFKVIAVDCDNTLWKGVCGEDGATGVTIRGGYRALQQFLIERYREGFLIVLCSKNNENDVWEVFEKNEGMLLKRDHVVAHRINWLPKSGNLHALADELNVGINSFIFIDDSGMECAEVRENAPDVLTLRLPEDERAIARFAGHIWGLDKWQITDEDRKRGSMYVAEQQRQRGEEQATSLEEFLSGLDLKIVMAPIGEHQIPRVSQLTQRTNQFNTTTIRRDESEVRALLADEDYYCRIITVEDRFGEYGLVGVVICRRDKEERKLLVDSLLLSCRVLGRGVEEAILSGMRRFAVSHGLTEVEALFIPTKKNAPALNFLQTWPGEREERENGGIVFRRPVNSLPDGIPFGEFEDRTEPLPEEEKEERKPSGTPDTKQENERKGREIPERGEEKATEEIAPGWEIDLIETAHLFHAPYYVPLAHASGRALLALPLGSETGASQRAPYILPETPDELALANIYGQVLRVDSANPVGMEDDFFALGGHSLTAVELLSRVHRHFRTEISLREIFEHPTPRMLLERIRAGEARSLLPILPIPHSDYYELSHAQRRLWALDDIQSEGTAYVMGGGLLVEGLLDADALESAFRAVVRRHESLRTGILLVENEPMAKVFDDLPFSVERIDLSNSSLTAEEKEARATTIARARSEARFDLSTPPLLRVTLIRLEENRHVLLLLLHHIIADGWSYTILLRELAALYSACRTANAEINPDALFNPLPIHYKEYAAWQRNELLSNRARQDEEFWLNRLGGPLPLLELPTDRPRPAQPSYAGGSVQVTIGRDEAAAIQTLCKAEGATLFTFLLASVRTLLWRYGGGRETVIGVPVAGRDHPDLADQIGFYVNTLAMRGGINPAQSFAGTLRAMREEVLESFAHRSTPFDLIAGKLGGGERDTSRSPVFDVMVALQNNRSFDEEIEGLRFRPFGEEAGAGKFDLVFNFHEDSDGIVCRLEYRTELFDRETILAIGEELVRLAGEAAHTPHESLADIAVRFEGVREADRKVAEASIPEGTMIDRFREVVHRFPEKIAVAQGGKRITYRELDERSNRIAAAIAGEEVRKGEIVAVLLERSVDLIATMLGIVKGGALYLPIDPAYPELRIRNILEDSGAVLVVGSGGENLPSGYAGRSVADLSEREENGIGEGDEAKSISADDPAYLIYTSGSTGRPKGVCVGHRGFLNMITAQIGTFGLTEADNVLQFASPAFDASLSEIFMALLAGASLTIPERKDIEEIESFLRLLEEANVSVATIPPVYLRALERRPLPTLRVLITAGEEAPRADVLHYAQSAAVFNAYGPTECSVCATIHRVEPESLYAERIPIGKPISGVGAFIADQDLRPLPDGVSGELILYGTGLAEGYVNDPATTGERFVRPAWLNGQRCYRTGDRARRLRNGGFEFLGRIDNQVKIRGHRVEPEEARQGLLRIAGVRDAAVLVADDPTFGKSLVAFVCGDDSLNAVAVQAEAARTLPSFLLPGRLHTVDALPMTVNGKVDRKRLEELHRLLDNTDRERSDGDAGPQTEIERVLAEVIAEVLRLERVGANDNFFALGGDSMKAIQVRAALGRRGYDLRSRHIFEGGTIAGIAGYVRTAEINRGEEADVEGAIPTTPIQKWMIERLTPEEWKGFGLPLVVDAGERIDATILRRGLLDLANGHDALRMRGTAEEGELSLEIGPRFDEVSLQEFDLRDMEDGVREKVSSILHTLSSRFVFDGKSPLFNAAIVRTPERDMAVLAFHHLTVDALSLEILLEDLNNAYAAHRDGAGYAIADRSASFGAWARSLEEYAESIPEGRRAEWRERVDRINKAARPFDPEERLYGTRSFLFTIGPTEREELLAVRRSGIEPHHVLLAALRRTVEELTGTPEPAVMIEGHGRGADTPLDTARTVGWFTATYPIILSAENNSIREELRGIRATLDSLKGREGEYGTLRYCARDQDLRRGLAAEPQISFNYLGEYGGAGRSCERTFEHTGHETAGENRSLSDFEMHVILEDGTIKVRYTCGPAVPDSFADRFGKCYGEHVREIAARLSERDGIEMRLICLPWVGGNSRSFDPLAAALPASVEVIPLELPGHGGRLHETPLERIEEIVPDLIKQMADCVDRPYMLFGHSMGALLAYETAHAIRAAGLSEPAALICAGAAAPQNFTKGREGKKNVDEEMIAAFYSDGTTSVRAEERSRMVAAAQADLRAAENYRYAERERLTIPVALLYGGDDDIPTEAMEGWRNQTDEEISFHEIVGGHDFPARNPADTAAAIVRICEEMKLETSVAE